MTSQERFGGTWTQEKLLRLRAYLEAYMEIFKDRTYFETIYVDAFAGTGSVPLKKMNMDSGLDTQGSASEQKFLNFEALSVAGEPVLQDVDTDQQEFLEGSTRAALEIKHPFKRYLFIERNKKKCLELERLKTDYPHLAQRIEIEHADANEFLMRWCRQTDWSKRRAVVFLDPFGMQVDWSLLEVIAATKSIDLWLLVPLGIGVNRMLTKGGEPSAEWAARLTLFFGSDEWKDKFYGPKKQPGLFDAGDEREKNADFTALKGYFVEQMKTIFAGVAAEPLTLRNSRNSPLYLLCFAAGNAKGAITAVKIAQHLLKE